MLEKDFGPGVFLLSVFIYCMILLNDILVAINDLNLGK